MQVHMWLALLERAAIAVGWGVVAGDESALVLRVTLLELHADGHDALLEICR